MKIFIVTHYSDGVLGIFRTLDSAEKLCEYYEKHELYTREDGLDIICEELQD